jgi:hypothetical protein
VAVREADKDDDMPRLQVQVQVRVEPDGPMDGGLIWAAVNSLRTLLYFLNDNIFLVLFILFV